MQKYSILLLFLFTSHFLFAQKKNKSNPVSFCGFSYSDTVKMREHFSKQSDFLKIRDNDTIVDIGAQSGSYEGILSVIGDFNNVSFFLVDIDSNCLNTGKINNMVQHYQTKSGRTFNHNFKIINNTADSLWLPLHTF